MLLAYTGPAVLVWAVVGLVLNVLPLGAAALVAIVVYALFYGVHETAGRAVPAPPGSTWQVPSGWVRNASRWRRIAVWGSMLGPGFATRNPYAGFGLLLLAVAAAGDVRDGVAFAAAIGLAHAVGRSLALIRDTHQPNTAAGYLQVVLRGMRWRMADGYALFLIAGIAIVIFVTRFA